MGSKQAGVLHQPKASRNTTKECSLWWV